MKLALEGKIPPALPKYLVILILALLGYNGGVLLGLV